MGTNEEELRDRFFNVLWNKYEPFNEFRTLFKEKYLNLPYLNLERELNGDVFSIGDWNSISELRRKKELENKIIAEFLNKSFKDLSVDPSLIIYGSHDGLRDIDILKQTNNPLFKKIIAIESNEEALEKAKKNFENMGLKINPFLGKIENFPSPNLFSYNENVIHLAYENIMLNVKNYSLLGGIVGLINNLMLEKHELILGIHTSINPNNYEGKNIDAPVQRYYELLGLEEILGGNLEVEEYENKRTTYITNLNKNVSYKNFVFDFSDHTVLNSKGEITYPFRINIASSRSIPNDYMASFLLDLYEQGIILQEDIKFVNQKAIMRLKKNTILKQDYQNETRFNPLFELQIGNFMDYAIINDLLPDLYLKYIKPNSILFGFFYDKNREKLIEKSK